MATAEHGQDYQRWLAKINQVCGHFAARPLEGRFHGEIDASYAGTLKVSTVTASGVNLFRTRNEIKRSNDDWFYTVFQLSGQAAIEQDDRQVVLDAGDITLIDASRPCSIFWQQTSRQASLLLPRQLLEQQLRGSEISIATRLEKSLPMVQLSQRLLQESMCSPELSESESAAALEAIVCLLRPMLHHHDPRPSRREKQFQKIMDLIDESIQAEHLRPEWLASETGMSVRSLYRLFADKGWWSHNILRTGVSISARRHCTMPVMTKSWRELAIAGDSATTATSRPLSNSVLAYRPGIPQALPLIFIRQWAADFRPPPRRCPAAASSRSASCCHRRLLIPLSVTGCRA